MSDLDRGGFAAVDHASFSRFGNPTRVCSVHVQSGDAVNMMGKRKSAKISTKTFSFSINVAKSQTNIRLPPNKLYFVSVY